MELNYEQIIKEEKNQITIWKHRCSTIKKFSWIAAAVFTLVTIICLLTANFASYESRYHSEIIKFTEIFEESGEFTLLKILYVLMWIEAIGGLIIAIVTKGQKLKLMLNIIFFSSPLLIFGVHTFEFFEMNYSIFMETGSLIWLIPFVAALPYCVVSFIILFYDVVIKNRETNLNTLINKVQTKEVNN